MNIFTPEFITAVSGCVAAVTALVVAICNGVKAAKLSKQLDDAKQRQTYTVCPHCKKKIPLSELAFYLPSGEKDQDLNGKPDYLEE